MITTMPMPPPTAGVQTALQGLALRTQLTKTQTWVQNGQTSPTAEPRACSAEPLVNTGNTRTASLSSHTTVCRVEPSGAPSTALCDTRAPSCGMQAHDKCGAGNVGQRGPRPFVGIGISMICTFVQISVPPSVGLQPPSWAPNCRRGFIIADGWLMKPALVFLRILRN